MRNNQTQVRLYCRVIILQHIRKSFFSSIMSCITVHKKILSVIMSCMQSIRCRMLSAHCEICRKILIYFFL